MRATGRRQQRRQQPHGESWRRVLRRARRAIDSSLRLIDTSARVLDATERVAAQRPIESCLKLERLHHRLCKAVDCLDRGRQRVAGSIALAAWQDPSDATALSTMEVMLQWAEALRKLAFTARHLDGSFRQLCDDIKAGRLLPEPGAFTCRRRPPAAATPATLLAPRLRRSAQTQGRIRHTAAASRRRLIVPAPYTGIARRVIRGRAPPAVSTCTL